MRIAEWKMSPPRPATFQNAPPSLFSEDTSRGLFKYVDDTEVYKVVENKRTSHAQSILNEGLHGLLKTCFNYIPLSAMN